MAGRKRRSRPGYKARYERYKNQLRYNKNKRLKTERHERKIEKEKVLYSKKNEIVSSLVEECHKRFKLGQTVAKAKYLLKRIVGTLSEKKLRALLDSDNLSGAEWFRDRRLTPALKDMLRPTKFPHALYELMSEV